MANKNGQKGTQFETAVVNYIREGGDNGTHVKARRLAKTGEKDLGDVELHGKDFYFTLQCKDWGRLDFAGWVDDAIKQQRTAGTDWGAVVAKRRGKNVSRAYVVMDLETFRNLMENVL